MAEWRAFYSIDPFGDQRADLRMARIESAIYATAMKSPPAPSELMPFPDEAHDLPDGLTAKERRIMLRLNRIGG